MKGELYTGLRTIMGPKFDVFCTNTGKEIDLVGIPFQVIYNIFMSSEMKYTTQFLYFKFLHLQPSY